MRQFASNRFSMSFARQVLSALALLAGFAFSAQAQQSFVHIQNRWKGDHFVNIEAGRVDAGIIKAGWHSAQWMFERVPGSNYFWIRNRWKTDQ